MISPDMVNGAFEATGAVLTFMNFVRVVKDRGYAGLYLPACVFFTSWGVWNLYYYTSLQQPFSFFGGCLLVTANVLWLVACKTYGRKQ